MNMDIVRSQVLFVYIQYSYRYLNVDDSHIDTDTSPSAMGNNEMITNVSVISSVKTVRPAIGLSVMFFAKNSK